MTPRLALKSIYYLLEKPSFRTSGFARAMSTSSVGQTDQLAPGLLGVLKNNTKRLRRIQFLGELFKADGFELRIAGGAVRDIIRGKEPKDIDFATTARPDQSLDIVKRHEDLLRVIVTTAGQRHGTVAVKFKEAEIDLKRIKLIHGDDLAQKSALPDQKSDKTKQDEPEYDDESPYEITTLRCDVLTDGRHAEVQFINDWHKDAERRDLTINAMFLTLDDGRLIDYFNGKSDLEQGLVRFVGDAEQRVKEDYLRILRFFRFWSRYGLGRKPDESTLDVLRNNLSGLNQISGERIWQEIKKTLAHLPCHEVYELMLDLRVFDFAGLADESIQDYKAYSAQVLTELRKSEENILRYLVEVLNSKHGASLEDQTRKRIKDLIPVILFSAVIRDEACCMNAYKRIKLSNLERDIILYIVQNRNKCLTLKAYKYQLAMAPVPERRTVLQRMRAHLISEGRFEFIDELQNWDVPKFPVNGSIVARAAKERKLPASKTKDILEAIKLRWAQDDYTANEAELKDWMETYLDEMSDPR